MFQRVSWSSARGLVKVGRRAALIPLVMVALENMPDRRLIWARMVGGAGLAG